MNVLPWPSVLATSTWPPCISVSTLTIDRPRPVPGSPALRAFGRADEPVEQPPGLRLGDADAAVGNVDPPLAAVVVRRDAHLLVPVREPDRVRDQVVQDLRQPALVTRDVRPGAGPQLDGDALLGRAGRRRPDRLEDQVGYRDRGQVQRQRAGLEPVQHEQVADEPVQPVGVALDDVEENGSRRA